MRQMADQAAHVRRIAIEKRKVTPRLSGNAYAAAAARATPPGSFARYLKRRSVEGFLFPARTFLPSTTAASLISRQIERSSSAGRRSTCGRSGAEADALRRPHDRVARRARGGAPPSGR